MPACHGQLRLRIHKITHADIKISAGLTSHLTSLRRHPRYEKTKYHQISNLFVVESNQKSRMKSIIIDILLWTGYLSASPGNSDDVLSLESTSDRRSFPIGNDMEPHLQSRRRPLFRMSVNQHWLVHAHVSILPTMSKCLGERWVVSATQLIPFESPRNIPLRFEEPLRFEQGTMRTKFPRNASVTLFLPRGGNSSSEVLNGSLAHHSGDQESLWAIALIRILNNDGQNSQNRRDQLIMRTIVTFPQRIAIPNHEDCIPTAFDDCPHFRTSPVATIYLNATAPFHLHLYRKETAETSGTYLLLLITVFILAITVQAMTSTNVRTCLGHSKTFVWAQRLATLISTHVKNTIPIRKRHGTPPILYFQHDPIEWDAHEDRLDGSSNNSWYVSNCNSPSQHESLWLSAYSYNGYEDDTDEHISEPENSDPNVVLNAPPFIIRKFASTVWSFSALLELRKREECRVELSEAEFLGKPFSVEMDKQPKAPNLSIMTETAYRNRKISCPDNQEDDSDNIIHVSEQRNYKSNNPAAITHTQDGELDGTFETLHNNSFRVPSNEGEDPSIMDDECVYNAQRGDMLTTRSKDRNGMEISCNLTTHPFSEMSHAGSTSTDFCESWNNYGEVSSFYDPQDTTIDCVKESSIAEELLSNNDQEQQQRECTTRGLLQNTKPKPLFISATQYIPSEDILNRSRLLLEPVWLFRPSPSSTDRMNQMLENNNTHSQRSDHAKSRTQNEGRGSSKTKRNADGACKRNVKAKIGRITTK